MVKAQREFMSVIVKAHPIAIRGKNTEAPKDASAIKALGNLLNDLEEAGADLQAVAWYMVNPYTPALPFFNSMVKRNEPGQEVDPYRGLAWRILELAQSEAAKTRY